MTMGAFGRQEMMMMTTTQPTTTKASPISNRCDFVLLFDVKNGNPNGDPDGDNAPRTDPETGQGLVTDVCLKRKIRDYVALKYAGVPGMGIYVQHKAVLAAVKGDAYKALGLATDEEPTEEPDGEAEAPEGETEKKTKGKKKKPEKKATDVDKVLLAQRYMSENYFDLRTFGGVMSSKTADCGQLRGPVQLTFAESIDPVVPQRVTVTRCAVETQREADAQGGQNKTMGGKWIIPYGLYRASGFVVPSFAKTTGFSKDDLAMLWEAIIGMFDSDRSSARGLMAVRKLIVFEHDHGLGRCPAHKLLESVVVTRNDLTKPPRDFGDYTVTVRDGVAPAGVTIHHLVD